MNIKDIIQNKKYFVSILILLTIISRILAIKFFGDTKLDNEWGVLIDNLINFNTYAYYEFNNKLIPSAYMPPLYPFIIYFFNIISLSQIPLINLIFFLQIIFATISVFIFFQINKIFFSYKLAIINSYIFSFFPLNLYAVTQVSSVTLQILLSLFFLQYFFKLSKSETNKNILYFSIICGFALLARGEFLLLFFLSIIYIILSKKVRYTNVLKIILITILISSPYLIRNYVNFDKILFVNSKGYNLWKGNNVKYKVEGNFLFDSIEFTNLNSKLKNVKKDRLYEIKRDDIFLEEAINNISKNPEIYFKLFLKKIFSYYFVDFNSTYPKYYHFLHILPVLLLSILSFPGLLILLKKRNFQTNFIIIYVIFYTLIFSVFFILPRYKLVILPAQIILSTFFIKYFYEKYLIKKIY